jgi:predicted AAA+ superfamily ATPase
MVLWVLWRYAKGKMQTWVSQATLSRKMSTSINTVKRDLKLLEECKIIYRTYASGNDFKGNPIRKKQGYKFRLNLPLAWDLERAMSLKWKRAGRKIDCG